MTNKQFIDLMVTQIGDLAEKSKILKSVVIAQSILETGYGSSELFSKYNNALGLNWYNDAVCKPYRHVDKRVPQEVNGKWIYNIESMCVFDSVRESVECLMRWYTMRDKYKPIIGNTDYKDVCIFLTGKYATDSKYGEKLIKIIDQYNLTVYDRIEPNTDIYFVQTGAFIDLSNARRVKDSLIRDGFDTLIKYHAPYYRLQSGSFSIKANATKQINALKKKGHNAFITSEIQGMIIK